VPRRKFLRQILCVGLGVAAAEPEAAGADPRHGHGDTLEVREYNPTPRIPPSLRTPVSATVNVNQVGYAPDDVKHAIVPATAPLASPGFSIVDDDVTPQVRFRGTLEPVEEERARAGSYSMYYVAAFDSFARPGRYRVRLADGRLSPPFSIGKDVYSRLMPLVLDYFHTQSCGRHGSQTHGHCHLDDGVAIGGPHEGDSIDASGGWHDAGDYLKFVETTSYATALLLVAYERHAVAFPQKSQHGPLPLLLTRARVGLNWLLKMHPAPDVFYYQVGDTTDHDSWRLPEDDCPAANPKWGPRPVYFGVGANLAGRTSAAFALAARLYAPYDAAFASRCLTAARSVYKLGKANERVVSTLPASFYPEATWADDMEWGAAELFRSTQAAEYLNDAIAYSYRAGAAHGVSSVYDTHAVAHFVLYPHVGRAQQERLLGYLREDAELVRRQTINPYRLGTPYLWGTADGAAGAAMTMRFYGLLTGEKEYLTLATRQRDYILGCNPFGLSCVIGAGTRYPLYPHHQVANLRGIELSGAMVGGPTSFAIFKQERIDVNDLEFSTQVPGPPMPTEVPDSEGVYHDVVQDYVTNEPANDYAAKFLLVAAYDADSAS
jgi:hypothetical protein